jgi:hypothetical protein
MEDMYLMEQYNSKKKLVNLLQFYVYIQYSSTHTLVTKIHLLAYSPEDRRPDAGYDG